MAKKLILLLVFAVLAIYALYHSASSSITPSELIVMQNAKGVVVTGKVEEKSYSNGYTHFYISDGKTRIKAIYKGEISASEVVATGDWIEGILYVKELLGKCHTEYGGG
ncbi:MAG: cytochrome c maturation protein CcmE [Archaeoglobaceae archaeon]